MTADQVIADLSPMHVVALTAWSEARARFGGGRWVPNPQQAMCDVINVIDNRVNDPRWRKLGHKGVCLYPFAFSCWLPSGGRQNYDALIGTARLLLEGEDVGPVVGDCLALAAFAISGRLSDTLDGSCHYIADWLKPWPKWAVGKTPVVSRYGHLFFNNIR